MTGFTENQLHELQGKLAARHVRTRQVDRLELSYIEGWFAIAEANRIFGFDSWDRETVSLACVWQGKAPGSFVCSYSARVRITVRTGERTIVREGAGYGTGAGTNPGEAHENALKEAETDAMKRALITFGNRFGLALYDREQRGVTRARTRQEPATPWLVHAPDLDGTNGPTVCHSPHEFYSELRKHLERVQSPSDVRALWHLNEAALKTIREQHRELVDRAGAHYTAVFARLCRERAKELENTGSHPTPNAAPSTAGIDKSVLAIAAPRRIRDKDHLRFVAAQPCLVCGRLPAQAHHLMFVQPRARGLKTSDEWAVPLCAAHHRELHDHGDEQVFWESRAIDAERAAQTLWTQTRTGTDANAEGEAAAPIGDGQALIDETRFMVDPPGGTNDGSPHESSP
jgi:DNA recombination protein Rad52